MLGGKAINNLLNWPLHSSMTLFASVNDSTTTTGCLHTGFCNCIQFLLIPQYAEFKFKVTQTLSLHCKL